MDSTHGQAIPEAGLSHNLLFANYTVKHLLCEMF